MAGVFVNENVARGVTGANVKAGISNVDNAAQQPEQQISLPWALNPAFSWLDYHNDLEVRLNPGTILSKPLPQHTTTPDTLASVSISPLDDTVAEASKLGINLTSQNSYEDTVFQMATPTFYFILSGRAMRMGYKIPIPGLVTVAGVKAIPTSPQVASQSTIGNVGGVPIYAAQWELWYLIELPPKREQAPPPNFALHIAGDQVPPDSIQVPFSPTDTNAVIAMPTTSTLQTR